MRCIVASLLDAGRGVSAAQDVAPNPSHLATAVDGVFEEGGEEEETDELVGQVRHTPLLLMMGSSMPRMPGWPGGVGGRCLVGEQVHDASWWAPEPGSLPVLGTTHCRCWTRLASTSTPPWCRRRGRRWRRRRPRRQRSSPWRSQWAQQKVGGVLTSWAAGMGDGSMGAHAGL